MKPVAKVTRGSIQIAIWADRGKYGTFYKLTASRRYKKNDSWKNSSSFVEDDALILSKAFTDAYDVIRELRSNERSENVMQQAAI